MKINSFTAEGVHDYLKFDITFYPDLTFLIGINGSGKTSALKLILGLTSPSFHFLNQINYTFCEVVCSSINNEKDILIRAEQDKSNESFTIKLTLNGETTTTQPISRFIRKDDMSYDVDELIAIEQRHKEFFDNLIETKKIRNLATPKFLGLDRRIYEGNFVDTRFRSRRQFIPPKYRNRNYEGYIEPQAIDLSLDDVQALVFDYTRKIPQKQFEISDDFKQKMFSQSFSFVESYNFQDIPLSSEIIEKRKNVLRAIESLGFNHLMWSVNSFFTKVEDIAKTNEIYQEKIENDDKIQYSEDYLELLRKWYYNGNQLKRIDDIITYSQDYQKKIAELRAPFKKLEHLISNFLIEGKKELHIAEDGEIKVTAKNRQSSNIYGLSSGEKQIIIMIAHLIFEEAQGTSGVFIIDEPELSLHIAWQVIFVQSIMEASPNTQFILATHSPSIIARVDKEKYCQDLNKLNY